MREFPKNGDDKAKIVAQIADLSRLLGMIPSDDNIIIKDPATHKSLKLSEWLSEARNSFLKLSIQLDRTLNLNLQ